MRNALVVGMAKTGTTIVATVIQKSIPGALLYLEPPRVAFFERRANVGVPLVVKLLYEHWIRRPLLLSGIVRGETDFHPDKVVVIIRDPRDTLISALMYAVYERVMQGASREQVEQWVAALREKEADPQRHSLTGLIGLLARSFDVAYDPNWVFGHFIDYAAWIDSNRDFCYVMKYEDFVAGDNAALASYLGLDLSRSREVDPGLQRVARTRDAGAWRRMMLPEDVAYWRQRYGNALSALGYDNWDLTREPIDPNEGSAYVVRTAEEAFNTKKG